MKANRPKWRFPSFLIVIAAVVVVVCVGRREGVKRRTESISVVNVKAGSERLLGSESKLR